MALEDYFSHSCDIYHIIEGRHSPGYGLPESPNFAYPQEPDIEGVPCRFEAKSQTVTLSQSSPMMAMDASIKLVLPAGTDIRLNDRVVDRGTGWEYTADVPHDVWGHHVYAYVRKRDMWRQKDMWGGLDG